MKNKGTEFEKLLEAQHEAYRAQGRAHLVKTTPPTLIIRPQGRPQMIPLKNPFLDFVGSWKERNGQSLHIEAKRTEEHRLPINNAAGIKVEQWANLLLWESFGAAVCVLWQHKGECRLVSTALIHESLKKGKSVLWDDAEPLQQTSDLVFWDYLPVLARLYPC